MGRTHLEARGKRRRTNVIEPFLQKIRPEAAQTMRERIVAELKTTFASHYSRTVSLAEALQLDAISAYGKRATGEKYLINPNKGAASQ